MAARKQWKLPPKIRHVLRTWPELADIHVPLAVWATFYPQHMDPEGVKAAIGGSIAWGKVNVALSQLHELPPTDKVMAALARMRKADAAAKQKPMPNFKPYYADPHDR